MALDELMQTIEGRVRILELGEKLHYDLNAVFVGTIDFEGLNYYYWPPETEIKKVTEVYKALAKTGVRISSVPIEKLSQDPARYNARFGRADLVITKKDQVRNIHSGNIVVLVDEVDPLYTEHPQLVGGSLPHTDHFKFLRRTILDEDSAEALYGEKERELLSWSKEVLPSLLLNLFGGYGLNKTRVAQWVLNPLTDCNLIAQRQEAIEYFMRRDNFLDSRKQEEIELGALDASMKKILWAIMDLFQCKRGKVGIGFMKANIKRKIRITDNIRHEGNSFTFDPEEAKDVAEYCYQRFMEEAPLIVKALEKISFPDFSDTSVPQLRRIQRAIKYVMRDEKQGVPALKKTLQEILTKEPPGPKELTELLGEKNPLERFRYISSMLKSVAQEITLYAGLAAFFKEKEWVKPEILPKEERVIDIKDGLNPLLFNVQKLIPNKANFDQEHLVEIVEGPNEAGKSMYADMVAIVVNFAQAGFYVPATAARISIHERIFVRHRQVGTNTQSSFAAEKEALREMYASITGREEYSLVVLDEWGTATRGDDGAAILSAIAEQTFVGKGVRAILPTHFPFLRYLATHQQIRVSLFPFIAGEDGLKFSYKKLDAPLEGIDLDLHYGLISAKSVLPPDVFELARNKIK